MSEETVKNGASGEFLEVKTGSVECAEVELVRYSLIVCLSSVINK